MIRLTNRSLFHVHTFRCGHAEHVPDEAYILRAIDIGADSIWFADHAPFPGNPFGNRMKYEELGEYLHTLTGLKQKYTDQIAVHIGLEAEYFPSFDQAGYYNDLVADPRMEFLLLGQHMAEEEDWGRFSFSWDLERKREEEHRLLGRAVVQGIQSGYFAAVAHPDRIFRRRREWTEEMTVLSRDIIAAAIKNGIPLEQNASSMKNKWYYWPQFWEVAEKMGAKRIFGLDAHAVKALARWI
ncbi:MAG: PHP domain-containing protein [Clostridiales bacterium]|nr:PHP domain-containing protein [Clostridiales bacterium]